MRSQKPGDMKARINIFLIVISVIVLSSLSFFFIFQRTQETEEADIIQEIVPKVLAQTSLEDYDWPMFMHDPAHTGVSPENITNPPESNWNGELVGGRQVWKRNFGAQNTSDQPGSVAHGRAQPVIVNDVMYQGFMDNPKKTGFEGRFYAININTGQNYSPWGSNNPFVAGDSISGSAAVSQGIVVFGSWDGKIYALNTSDGTKRWEFNTYQPQADPPMIGGRIKASPIIVNNTIYVGSSNRYMYAVDLLTGGLKWKYRASGPIEGTASFANNKVIFMTEPGYDKDFPASQEHAIGGFALDANTGQVVWKMPLPGENTRSAYPIVNGNYVLFMTNPPGKAWEGTYDAFMTNRYCYLAGHGPGILCDGKTTYKDYYGIDGTLKYAAEFFDNYPHYKVTKVVNIDSGQERLFNIPGVGQKPLPFSAWYMAWIQPLVWRGKYFIFAYHNFWLADPETGQITWIRERADANPRIEEQSNLIIGGDTLYFFGDNKGQYLKLGADGKADTDPVGFFGPCTGCGHCLSSSPLCCCGYEQENPSYCNDAITTHYTGLYSPGQGNGCTDWGGVAVPYKGSLYFQTIGWFYRYQGN